MKKEETTIQQLNKYITIEAAGVLAHDHALRVTKALRHEIDKLKAENLRLRELNHVLKDQLANQKPE